MMMMHGPGIVSDRLDLLRAALPKQKVAECRRSGVGCFLQRRTTTAGEERHLYNDIHQMINVNTTQN
jgi:hypothetical protein